ncbi:pseudouridine synthase [Dendrothele bispora CBS 962.96]|uniref:Pseudouridine synthase n=1 Tax=Dendrothele bispora (strain CBS 962.96) TaxID=1314807 RepID=A0A4S8LMB8_DENBC|nr:pseudouridine synthase [Dendrothele bispora CBS 962.96]
MYRMPGLLEGRCERETKINTEYNTNLESGVTTINGKLASPNQIIRSGDCMETVVHRHEPSVSATPVKVLLEDKKREFLVVDKPASPVHTSGRYYRNTLVAILMSDFGYEKVYTVNRLDRLTSGLMIFVPTSSALSGTVRKEYIARCKGEVVCEEPLLTVDCQMGLTLSILRASSFRSVLTEYQHAKTIFQRIRYNSNTDSCVVLCKPLTGRSHQIQVHLQYLGHPIANDTVYSEEGIWGSKMGKGGIDTTHSSTSESLNRLNLVVEASETPEAELQTSKKLLPRETGEDIGMGSPVPLSSEAVEVITRLRNMKDEEEDWSRWRDVIFRAKGSLKKPSKSLGLYCPECYLPLHPDPKPEQLYIFLHALRRYTTKWVPEGLHRQ